MIGGAKGSRTGYEESETQYRSKKVMARLMETPAKDAISRGLCHWLEQLEEGCSQQQWDLGSRGMAAVFPATGELSHGRLWLPGDDYEPCG